MEKNIKKLYIYSFTYIYSYTYIYICITESLCYTVVINRTLQIKYISSKKIKNNGALNILMHYFVFLVKACIFSLKI